MDAMEKTQRLNRTIPCPHCGELYVITYKRCPFCGGGARKKSKAEAASKETEARMQETDLAAREATVEAVPAAAQDPAPAESAAVTEAATETEAAAAALEELGGTDSAPLAPAEEVPTEPATPEAAQPVKPYFVSELDLGDIDYGADIDWTPVLEEGDPIQGAAETQRGGKRLAKKTGFRWGRFFGALLSLILIAAAAYIVVTRVVPLVQERLEARAATQQEQQNQQKEDEPPATDPTAAFRLSDTKLTLTKKGESKQLTAIYEGEGTLGSLKWESSDTEVVRVSASGNLTAVAAGTAMITATRSDDSKAQCEVNCVWDENEPIANLSLNRTDFTLEKGATFALQVLGTEEAVTWSVEDSAVAMVSATGVVKHVGAGRTKVSATIGTQVLTCFVSCK